MSARAPDPGTVLRRALVAWGLGHLALGRTATGFALLLGEIAGIGLVAWLFIGLADTSFYLVPFLAGMAFIATWAWQAVAAYRSARTRLGAAEVAPPRSPALAIGWLSLPLLVWGTGFWLVAGEAASPAAVLDRFVTAWSDESLDADANAWPAAVVEAADRAAAELGTDSDRFRDVRVRVVEARDGRASAVAEAIHYERHEARFLWVFAGSELVPVADREVLALDLVAEPAELPGGGDIGAVRWEIVAARP